MTEESRNAVVKNGVGLKHQVQSGPPFESSRERKSDQPSLDLEPLSASLSASSTTRERILVAAADLFLDLGFSKASLNQIAKRAKTTKPTVYSYFKSKQALFWAVIDETAKSRLGFFSQMATPQNVPREDLIKFGETFVSIVLSPDARRWDRLAAAEAIAHPEIGQMFYDAGPARVLSILSQYLSLQKKSGRLSIPNCERAAEQLIGLFLGVDMLRSLIGQPLPDKRGRKRKVGEAVDLFLARYEVQS